MALTSLDRLQRRIPAAADRLVLNGASSPIRDVTRQIAFDPGGWTKERAEKVAALFNGMAADWSARHDAHHGEPLADALVRGGPYPERARVCEVGSGTGLLTPMLVATFDTVIAVEIAEEMARLAPTTVGIRMLADGASLPAPRHSYDVVVLFNAFLFPAELDRVLAPGGALVWVSGMADDTPIYLSIEDVGAALPGPWRAVTADAGWGTWAVYRRG